MTANTSVILCDGCGQPASSAHIARRLQRLEWATRYRPIHLHTLLLGAISPQPPAEFLYSPEEAHSGEAANLPAARARMSIGRSIPRGRFPKQHTDRTPTHAVHADSPLAKT